MDFWRKYFTNTAAPVATSPPDDGGGGGGVGLVVGSPPDNSADVAVTSLARTTSKIMISTSQEEEDDDQLAAQIGEHDDYGGEEERYSRKRPISSIDNTSPFLSRRESSSAAPSLSARPIIAPFNFPPSAATTTTTTNAAPTTTTTTTTTTTSSSISIPKPSRYHTRASDYLSPPVAPTAIIRADTEPRYVCPYCDEEDFSTALLIEHVQVEHAGNTASVVCPICAAQPWGDPNYTSADFQGHLSLRHRDGGSYSSSRGHRSLHYSHFTPPVDEFIIGGGTAAGFLGGSYGLGIEEGGGSSYRSSRSGGSTPSSSAGGNTLWDWIVQQDISKPSSPPARVICFGSNCRSLNIKQGEATCVLACGHTFHSNCLEAEGTPSDDDEEIRCPTCHPPTQNIFPLAAGQADSVGPMVAPSRVPMRKKVKT